MSSHPATETSIVAQTQLSQELAMSVVSFILRLCVLMTAGSSKPATFLISLSIAPVSVGWCTVVSCVRARDSSRMPARRIRLRYSDPIVSHDILETEDTGTSRKAVLDTSHWRREIR